MRAIFLILPVITALLLGSLLAPSAFAQFQSGGVDKDGSWYVGEGLKHGDYFSYTMCHVDHYECAEFKMDFWFKGDVQTGSETKWLVEAVVYDGSKVIRGEIELGKIAPEPTGGTDNLSDYQDAFRSSIVWLSAFATADTGISSSEGPKEFREPSWGKIANIGGEQIRPILIETIVVPSGLWEDTVQISWKTGGGVSRVWVADDFPFPVMAETFVHVSEGIPSHEYRFSLVEYRENVQDPFEGIVSTQDLAAAQGCDTDIQKEASVKKSTNNHNYQVHAFYGPEDPVQGCEMQWLIKFIDKYDDTEFLNQVQFDFYVVDEEQSIIRSIAEERGREYLYSPSGQYTLDMIVKEDPGIANYVVFIRGLGPDRTLPTTNPDFLEISVPIFAGQGGSPPSPVNPPVTPPPQQNIPDWVKNTAGWWAEGAIDDESFVGGIQFLIEQGIMTIPPTSQGTGGGSEIPDWVKNMAGWWAQGAIDDESFVGGIQFLIEQGIINIS